MSRDVLWPGIDDEGGFEELGGGVAQRLKKKAASSTQTKIGSPSISDACSRIEMSLIMSPIVGFRSFGNLWRVEGSFCACWHLGTWAYF